jgi:flagellar hook assembly protein FlgD
MLLVGWLWLVPGFLRAAFTSLEDQMVSARIAGAGGAWEAGPRGADSALMNPAGLPTRQGSDLLLNVGTLGATGADLGSALVTLPVDEGLMLAASYNGLLEGTGLGYAENTASLDAALELTPWLSAGGRYNWQQVEFSGGSATGGSLDLGLRARMGISARQGLILAAGVRNAVSFWADPNWAQSVPVDLKAGLGWAWAGNDWVGLEFSRILASTPALADVSLFRMGAEHRFASGFSARAGLSTDAQHRLAIGGGWESRGNGPGLHLALLSSDTGIFSGRMELQWVFATRTEPTVSVAPLEIRYEEGTKRVKEAKFAVNMAEDQKAEAWELEIRDKDGRVVRVIQGSGTPPGYVSWDGKDASGAWVDDGDQVSYRLNIKTPDGEAASRPLLAGDMSIGASGLSALDISGPGGGQSSLPALMPVFGDDGKEVDHFMIKMPSSSGPTSHWKILIKDSQGNVLQAIEGSGALPTELSWDGKNTEGMRINDASHLQISLVTLDMSGKSSEISGTVYSQAGLTLDWGADKETRLQLRVAPFSPGERSWQMSMSDVTLEPLAVPKIPLVKTAASPGTRPMARAKPRPPLTAAQQTSKLAAPRPKPKPTAAPSPAATAVRTEAPTPQPSPLPTAEPTPLPTARPTVEARPPYQVLSSTPNIRIHSQLGGTRMAFTFLPPPATPEPSGPQRPLSPETLRRIHEAHIPQVVDVFGPQSATEVPKLVSRLDLAYQRYRGLGFKQIRLTGLVQEGEAGGEALSRARAVRMSELLVQRGFKGEFVIWVKGEPGKEKGVRIEAIR